MKTAEDLMTANPFCCSLHQNVQGLFDLFLQHRIHAVPIIDEKKCPIGLVEDSSAYIILIKHRYSSQVDKKRDILENYQEYIEPPTNILATTPIEEVIRTMSSAVSKRLIVIDSETKRLVGLISPIDVVEFLLADTGRIQELHDDLKELKQEIGELKGQLEDTQIRLSTYKSLYENSPNLMYSVDSRGKIVMANMKMHQVLRYGEGELIGKTIFDIYPESHHPAVEQGLKDLIKTGKFEKAYISLVTKEKWLVTVDLMSSALVDEQGNFVATITTARPVGSSQLNEILYQQYKDH